MKQIQSYMASMWEPLAMSGGFYGWRLAHKNSRNTTRSNGKILFLKLLEDQRNGLRVCLMIEAPLWGQKSQVETNLKKVVGLIVCG